MNKEVENGLRKSQQSYEALMNSVDGILWQADATTFQFTFVSRQAERLLGYPVERWLNEPDFWVKRLHNEDREWAVNFSRARRRRLRTINSSTDDRCGRSGGLAER
jgi:PAS domain-containing protein